MIFPFKEKLFEDWKLTFRFPDLKHPQKVIDYYLIAIVAEQILAGTNLELNSTCFDETDFLVTKYILGMLQIWEMAPTPSSLCFYRGLGYNTFYDRNNYVPQ